MIATYRDLESKRFEVIADFESAQQGPLFRIDPPDSDGSVQVTTERARTETGVGALRVGLRAAGQRAIAADNEQTTWTLHRDWSKHHLLIFSVFSPRQLSGFTFSIASGTDEGRFVYQHPRILLEQGWNLIRLDLGRLATTIDTGDVRELAFWCQPLDTPVDLYLDDIILVDNAEEVFATAEREPGDLYVIKRGRELVVGAVDRFELVFSRGTIHQWFDLVTDPSRTHNLTGVGMLGPTPAVIPAGADEQIDLDRMSQWSGLGIAAEVYQSLIEANAVRAVVQGEWRFGAAQTTNQFGGPAHRWVYTVYRDGRIYVESTGTARTETFQPPGLGLAFCCDEDLGFQRAVANSGEGDPLKRQESYLTLFSRAGADEADLLVVPFRPFAGQPLDMPDDSRTCALWNLFPASESWSFSGLMRVSPPDIDSLLEAASMAVDYRRALPIKIDAGHLIRTDVGDFDNDGFNESQGCYVLQLDGMTARVRLDGTSHLRFSPTFKILNVLDRDVWVYVDGRLIPNAARDPEGNLLFIVDGIVTEEILIEITSRARSAASR